MKELDMIPDEEFDMQEFDMLPDALMRRSLGNEADAAQENAAPQAAFKTNPGSPKRPKQRSSRRRRNTFLIRKGAIAREKGADPVAPQKDTFFVVFTAGVGVAAFLAAVVGGIATFKKHASKKKKEEVATDEETSEPSDNLELQDKTVD